MPWEQVVAFCVSATTVLAFIGTAWVVIPKVLNTLRRANRAIEQILGDEQADPPIPSLAQQVSELREELTEHTRWHGDPGGNPARPTPRRPNGGAVRGGRRRPPTD